MSLPDDVVRFVERSFQASERDEALAALRGAKLHDGTDPGPRLLRCAVVSARRDLGRLRTQVAHMAIDYRDVIVEGEYVVSRGGKLERVRNLNEPIAEDA